MVDLIRATPNKLTGYQSNVAIKKSDVKKQLIAEAEASCSKDNIVAPKVTTNADTQDEVDKKIQQGSRQLG